MWGVGVGGGGGGALLSAFDGCRAAVYQGRMYIHIYKHMFTYIYTRIPVWIRVPREEG